MGSRGGGIGTPRRSERVRSRRHAQPTSMQDPPCAADPAAAAASGSRVRPKDARPPEPADENAETPPKIEGAGAADDDRKVDTGSLEVLRGSFAACFDDDDDKHISYQEFSQNMKLLRPRDDCTPGVYTHMEDEFTLFDIDGDGLITEDEFIEVVSDSMHEEQKHAWRKQKEQKKHAEARVYGEELEHHGTHSASAADHAVCPTRNFSAKKVKFQGITLESVSIRLHAATSAGRTQSRMEVKGTLVPENAPIDAQPVADVPSAMLSWASPTSIVGGALVATWLGYTLLACWSLALGYTLLACWSLALGRWALGLFHWHPTQETAGT